MKKWGGGQLDIRPPQSKNWGGRVPPIPPRTVALEYQSSVSLPYIGSALHKIVNILKAAGIQVYHSSEDKLFRSL